MLQEMNIQYSEILCHFSVFILKENNLSNSKSKMLSYVNSILSGTKRNDSNETNRLTTILKYDNLKSAYPMIWKSVETGSPENRDTLLLSLLQYFEKQPTLNASKYSLFGFISRLILLTNHVQFNGENHMRRMKAHFFDFVKDLPKLLWNLKQSNTVFTHAILLVLNTIFKHNYGEILDDKIFMNNFYRIYETIFQFKTTTGLVKGPFKGFNDQCQKLALDLIWFIKVDYTLVQNAVHYFGQMIVSCDITVYFLDIMDSISFDSDSPGLYLGALFTLCIYGFSCNEIEFHSKSPFKSLSTVSFYEMKRKYTESTFNGKTPILDESDFNERNSRLKKVNVSFMCHV